MVRRVWSIVAGLATLDPATDLQSRMVWLVYRRSCRYESYDVGILRVLGTSPVLETGMPGDEVEEERTAGNPGWETEYPRTSTLSTRGSTLFTPYLV